MKAFESTIYFLEKKKKKIYDELTKSTEIINANELKNTTKDMRNHDTAAKRFSPYPSPLEEDQPQNLESPPSTCLEPQNAKSG